MSDVSPDDYWKHVEWKQNLGWKEGHELNTKLNYNVMERLIDGK